ncbi:MAG: alginate export family protein [Algisphaera sp.]
MSCLLSTSRCLSVSFCLSSLFLAGNAQSQTALDGGALPDISEAEVGGVEGALRNGKIKLNMRARLGYADFDNGSDSAFSPTLRTRLGYLTGDVEGFSAYLEFEDVQSLDDEGYNSTQNGNTGKAVIADVEGTEVNQSWIRYASASEGTRGAWEAKMGRQVIALDDHRFVGHVGWRQDQQTFDAVRWSGNLGVDGLAATAGYITQVNRIFGEAANFDSESFFVNASYKLASGPKVTGFVYGLDFENAAANSSLTLGGRVTGKYKLSDSRGAVKYAASVAMQSDFGNNPNDYDALYYALDVAWATPENGTIGLGYEVLGSDDGTFGFRTPLATLHKFNGFADVFLVTPNDGLADLYAYYGLPLPKAWKAKGKIIGHLFKGDDSGDDLGIEIDAVISKKLTDNLTVGGKLAWFNGEDGTGPFDRTRLTVDLTYAF